MRKRRLQALTVFCRTLLEGIAAKVRGYPSSCSMCRISHQTLGSPLIRGMVL